jgi:acetyl esterase/lipase
MDNMVYYHTVSPGIESKLIQRVMGLMGMKRIMEKKIMSNGFRKEPAPILQSIQKNNIILEEEHLGRKIWTISPRESEPDTIIFFLHGGAYYANMTKHHWRFIEQLLNCKLAIMIVPDYPLAPESTCKDVYQFLDTVYAKLISDHTSKHIVLMGDSAGGGLALGFAQAIKKDNIKQPEQIILFSPWLDVSMTNPDIAKVEKSDKILSVKGLKTAGKKYAGNLDLTDYRVSPIYGDLSNLGRISIFIGTNEVFIADARKLRKLMEDRNIEFSYYEYPDLFHDWVIISNLREAKDVIHKIAFHLNSLNSFCHRSLR